MFYENLTRICQEKGMSIWQLVDSLELAHANAHYWKNGRLPKLETVMKIAERLGVSAAELLKE